MFTKVNSKDVSRGIRIGKRLLKCTEVCQCIYICTRQMIIAQPAKEDKKKIWRFPDQS